MQFFRSTHHVNTKQNHNNIFYFVFHFFHMYFVIIHMMYCFMPFGTGKGCYCRMYVRTHKYRNSTVVCMSGAVHGSLSVRKMAIGVAVPKRTKYRIDM